ncbi:MAG TPA: 16S rRNA (cytidine(1402)-2'-O)-methyltransferase [Polyangiaceae bacterium LLY-WYZ-15_(1-7)]|nr:16S rRNA (cytidine(1402)-2'-O)-methyltransferase [Myxococcales bacterium]MAT27930.1 16S rRNA (cytidine(1402)-2'-O)-methyltransferase [Sandaracinus sp.]HJK92766.1 16S rRNA (cytidine(1402)-2'-O)-methyltransferase [Polyangiaceae bacterium LLY-WYZ-15_(1-7)]MBJ72749.1 16S rRNA (cytidine(1402)-2'-O)-methyltransferase [Sandaracinus sp.]HJL06073.1 16S rRNA (cytidine(1402)-2'-O)-methyltransferase [Polyangiaceae bacterium LLY-WYZ-15_(1-7)]
MSAPGTLWVVATPIGHLDDLTLRALRVLEEADAVLAEDTRHSKKLLAHHGIQTPLRSLHAHTPDAKIAALVEELAAGASFALVSDAGTPIVSDPGIRLVAAARERGLPVTTAPGPSAVLAALTLAGLRADRFRFVGFLPRSGGKRTAALDELAADPAAQVLFESPRRLGRLLTDLAPRLGERRLAVCRELTKLHEEVRRGTAAELAEAFAEGARGEITVVVEATDTPTQAEPEIADPDAFVRERRAAGDTPKQIAKALAAQSGLSRREAYARVVEVSQSED